MSNLIKQNAKTDIIGDLIFNENNIKIFDRLEPRERLEILYGFFDMIESRQDKETFFIDIVDDDNRRKANEWMSEFSVEERKDFKDFYSYYYQIFIQKPTK